MMAQHWSAEARARHSAIMKARYQDPAYRKNLSASLRKVMSSTAEKRWRAHRGGAIPKGFEASYRTIKQAGFSAKEAFAIVCKEATAPRIEAFQKPAAPVNPGD